MDGLIMAGQMLLGLSILVILHEFGHFLAARAFGIKVEKFYLFFDAWGIKLFKFRYKDCEYGIGWLPLGGYVKIAGMIDESMDTKQLEGPPQPWEFRSKPAWQRLIVMLGGIIVNIILGIFIFWMLTFKYGETYVPNDKAVYGVVPGVVAQDIGIQIGDKITQVNGKTVVKFKELVGSEVLMGGADLTLDRAGETVHIRVPDDILNKVADHHEEPFLRVREPLMQIAQVEPKSAAATMGLQPGDSIVQVGDQSITYFDQLTETLLEQAGDSTTVKIIRNGQPLELSSIIPETGKLGFYPNSYTAQIAQQEQYGLLESLPIGAAAAWGSLADNAKGLGKMLTGDVNPRKALAGPVGIAQMFGAEVNWVKFWSLVGLLSMALALMNLLPIPGLDGGHTLFLLVEMVQGKPLNEKFLERAQIVGFVILVALMIFVFGNDILKIFDKG